MMNQNKLPAILIENLRVSYNSTPVLIGIDLHIDSGLLVGILGPNGAGKSTLFKAIMGLVPIDRGRILVDGDSIDNKRSSIAYVPQKESIDWDYPITVEEVALIGRYPHLGLIRRPGKADMRIVQKGLQAVGIEHLAKRQIGQLSGGQQQRVFLARALVQEADILLLDEPFVGVDAATEETVLSLVKKLKEEGRTIVIVSHDLGKASENFDRLALINQRLVAYGPVGEVFVPELLNQAYGGRLTMLSVADQMMVVN
jgi:manganese/zinc/iron transport system ATP- binding protein